MSMDNRQEIINVLNMKEHMVFRNRRMPRGIRAGDEGESSQHSHKDCAQNKSLREREERRGEERRGGGGGGVTAAWLPQLNCSNRCGGVTAAREQ